MAIGWFLVPYDHFPLHPLGPVRVCGMNRYTAAIALDGGAWSESECLGDHAIVKVRALDTTLTTIAQTAGFQRLPKDLLNDALNTLSNAQKDAITNKLQALGYSLAEIRADLGNNIGTKTLRDVLRFALKRRLKPRWNGTAIVLDGAEQVCRTVENVNGAV